MSNLASLISTDPRTALDKINRFEAYDIADAYKIAYPPNAPLETMKDLFRAHGVDVTKPLPSGEGIKWEPRVTQDENGKSVVQLEPHRVPNKTSLLNIDYDKILEDKAKEKKEQDTKLELQQNQIDALSGKIDNLAGMFQEFLQNQPKKRGRPKTN